MLRSLMTSVRPVVARSGLAALASTSVRSISSVEFVAGSPADWSPWTKDSGLVEWVQDRMKLLQPTRVRLCDGSPEEFEQMKNLMVQQGTLIPLNPELRPGSYLARSDPDDVARVEDRTYICSESEVDAGPTNNWMDPEQMMEKMTVLFDGCMTGRTMYAVPFAMGPPSSPQARIGVQLTDSPYVVANMHIMTRVGKAAMERLEGGSAYVPCVHTVGAPMTEGQADSSWPCNTEKYIVHFPEQRRIWSYGSGYGGNALLGKKCFALRIASAMARDEGWMAEHMLILAVTNPDGEKKHIAAAFPSACGKTNFAMMMPDLPGWKIECVGDDIAWLRIGDDGRMWAINPEAGFFGVAPGTSYDTNPMAMDSLRENSIFTNVALTPEGDVWWEGMGPAPERAISWKGREWFSAHATQPAAHPNSRFTVPAKQCPIMSDDWEAAEGVPIDAIVFGGRRSDVVPLVYESDSWQHGTYLGSVMNSETTAAAAGARGVLRSDPMAMKPFCGYNMGDYFQHWLDMGEKTEADKLPKIFYVNWFRKGADGKFTWPGFGSNIRVVDWIFDRCGEQTKPVVETAIGTLPDHKAGALNLDGLDVTDEVMDDLFTVDKSVWRAELKKYEEIHSQYGDRLPEGIKAEHARLLARLS